MIIIGVDTETTGVKVENGDRIVELCMMGFDGRTEEEVFSYTARFNPGMNIAQDAQRVHGISNVDVASCPYFKDEAGKIVDLLKSGDVLVAHNMAFDGPFIGVELANAGLEVPSLQTFCTMESGRWSTDWGKKPNLGELCFATGVTYNPEAAHSADYDVRVMMAAFFEGQRDGFFQLDQDEATTEAVA